MIRKYIDTLTKEKLIVSTNKRISKTVLEEISRHFFSSIPLPFWIKNPLYFLLKSLINSYTKSITLWAITPGESIKSIGSPILETSVDTDDEINDFVFVENNDNEEYQLLGISATQNTSIKQVLTQYHHDILIWINKLKNETQHKIMQTTLADIGEMTGGTIASTSANISLFLIFGPPGIASIPLVLAVEVFSESPGAFVGKELGKRLGEYLSTTQHITDKEEVDIEHLISEFEFIALDRQRNDSTNDEVVRSEDDIQPSSSRRKRV